MKTIDVTITLFGDFKVNDDYIQEDIDENILKVLSEYGLDINQCADIEWEERKY